MTFKLRRRASTGPHVEVGVFVGPDRDHLQLAGELRLQPEEWSTLHGILLRAPHGSPPVLDVETIVEDGNVSSASTATGSVTVVGDFDPALFMHQFAIKE